MESNEVPDKLVEGVGLPVPAADAAVPSAPAPDYRITDCTEALRRVSAFADLPSEQLKWFIENSDEQEFQPGEFVFRKGDPPDWMIIYLEGEVQARWDESNLDDFVYIARAGDPATEISGKLPFSRMKEIEINGRAVVYTRALRFPSRLFPELIARLPALAERLVWIMLDRTRESIQIDERRDKLMALGKLSAGLAHELNNPAAAARRAASDLAEALDVLASTIGLFVESGIEREQAGELVDMQREAIERAASNDSMSALDAADAEDELLDALEELGVPEPWRLTEPLVAAGIDKPWLDRLQQTAGPASSAAVAWIAASLTAQGLAAEIAESTERMGKLVKAIKAYAFMDRGELVETDIHEGLETTLLVLGHKLKHTSIEVKRDYDRSLPKLTLRGSELNQVWTNLLANAIEALGDSGTIEIDTTRDGACARVDVIDDGPGIPPEIRDRVFDPFFTTKGVGEGTGLGLDTARRIVNERLGGSIQLESEPGRTVFHVWLPLDGVARVT